MTKKCAICGREFETKYKNKMTCSDRCSADLNRKRARERYRQQAKENCIHRNYVPRTEGRRKKKREPPKMNDLIRLSVEAREHGMSYGKYVEMLERKKKNDVR